MKYLILSVDAQNEMLLRHAAESFSEIKHILTANSFREAIQLFMNESPDLMTLDVRALPSLLSETVMMLHSLHPQCMIAAYASISELDSLYGALEVGACDYLLLPLNEAQAHKALGNLLARRLTYSAPHRLADDSHQLRSMKFEKALYRLCAGSSTHKVQDLYEEICEARPDYRRVKTCRIAIIPAYYLTIDRRLKDGEVVINLISRIADEIMQAYHAGETISRTRSSGEMLLFFSSSFQQAEQICQEIIDAVWNRLEIAIHAGLGNTLPFPNHARASAEQARFSALTFNLFEHENRVHTGGSALNQLFTYDLHEFEEMLFASALSGNAKSIEESVCSVSRQIFISRNFSLMQLDKLRTIYQGMRTAWVEAFRRQHPQAVFTADEMRLDYPFDEFGIFSTDLFERSLCRDLIALSKEMLITENRTTAGEAILAQVEVFLKRYYMKKFSQTAIAREFGLNASYLSRIFKQHYGVGMVDYVNGLRIEKAKEYLRKDDISIKRISEMLGFSDEKYFCRVFRNIEGISPSQYRRFL
ncbi:MAG: helix-turn-helix domain-containing protein [Clostridia bacterium]|nr:helix-turn-helix domain-containing protein [Clostridia bacterium]